MPPSNRGPYSRADWTKLQLRFRPPRDDPSVSIRLRDYASPEEIDDVVADEPRARVHGALIGRPAAACPPRRRTLTWPPCALPRTGAGLVGIPACARASQDGTLRQLAYVKVSIHLDVVFARDRTPQSHLFAEEFPKLFRAAQRERHLLCLIELLGDARVAQGRGKLVSEPADDRLGRVSGAPLDVRFVPIADSCTAAKHIAIRSLRRRSPGAQAERHHKVLPDGRALPLPLLLCFVVQRRFNADPAKDPLRIRE